jgi:hypothetical protein
MKKLLGIMAVTALAVSAFAQGQITFNNATGLVKQWTSATDPTLLTSLKGNVMVELISAPVGTTLANPNLTGYNTLASFLAANSGWAAATAATGGSNPGGLAVNGIFGLGNLNLNVAGGASAEYFVIGWTGANGGALGTATSYDTAVALGSAWFGQSAIFTTTTGDPNGTPATLPTGTKSTFGGMTLAPVVPEPATFALAGLGLAALVAFRRRN